MAPHNPLQKHTTTGPAAIRVLQQSTTPTHKTDAAVGLVPAPGYIWVNRDVARSLALSFRAAGCVHSCTPTVLPFSTSGAACRQRRGPTRAGLPEGRSQHHIHHTHIVSKKFTHAGGAGGSPIKEPPTRCHFTPRSQTNRADLTAAHTAMHSSEQSALLWRKRPPAPIVSSSSQHECTVRRALPLPAMAPTAAAGPAAAGSCCCPLTAQRAFGSPVRAVTGAACMASTAHTPC